MKNSKMIENAFEKAISEIIEGSEELGEIFEEALREAQLAEQKPVEKGVEQKQ